MIDILGSSIDAGVLSELRAATDDIFDRIIEFYLADGEIYITKISDAIKSNDYMSVQKAAHALKSPSAQVGALKLQNLLAQLEVAAKNDSGAMQGIFNLAKSEYEIVRAELGQIIGQS